MMLICNPSCVGVHCRCSKVRKSALTRLRIVSRDRAFVGVDEVKMMIDGKFLVTFCLDI